MEHQETWLVEFERVVEGRSFDKLATLFVKEVGWFGRPTRRHSTFAHGSVVGREASRQNVRRFHSVCRVTGRVNLDASNKLPPLGRAG
jgi:hypothetical protein